LSITGWANYTKKAEKEIDKKKVEKMNVCCKILMFSTIIRYAYTVYSANSIGNLSCC
jgi:hypothetical protein